MSDSGSRRDHLVETAIRLFKRDGFHATGIDTILSEAGVAKMTLYKHFKSKDDLIVAALERRDERWMTWFRGELKRRGRTPEKRLLLVFDLLKEWFEQPDFRGCMFINAASEYGGLDPRIAEVCAHHKRILKQEIEELAEQAGAKRPAELSQQLALLVEGAIVMALIEEKPEMAAAAKGAALILIRGALPQGSRPDPT